MADISAARPDGNPNGIIMLCANCLVTPQFCTCDAPDWQGFVPLRIVPQDALDHLRDLTLPDSLDDEQFKANVQKRIEEDKEILDALAEPEDLRELGDGDIKEGWG